MNDASNNNEPFSGRRASKIRVACDAFDVNDIDLLSEGDSADPLATTGSESSAKSAGVTSAVMDAITSSNVSSEGVVDATSDAVGVGVSSNTEYGSQSVQKPRGAHARIESLERAENALQASETAAQQASETAAQQTMESAVSQPSKAATQQTSKTATSTRPSTMPAGFSLSTNQSEINVQQLDTKQAAPARQADVNQTASARQANAKQAIPSQPNIVRKRKKRRSKHRGLKVAGIIAAILIVLALILFGIYKYLVWSGSENMLVSWINAQLSIFSDADSDDEGRTVTYNGKRYKLNENVVSVCLIGYDKKPNESSNYEGTAGQADAVMVLAIDTQTGNTVAIGVPRDSMVDVSQFLGVHYAGVETTQLCRAFNYGDGAETSCEYTVQAVQRILYNMPITYYLALNIAGVADLNDAVGGVSLTPIETIPNTNIVEGVPTTLFGNNALKYVQYRNTALYDSALNRQARQEQYVHAFTSQVLSSAKEAGGVSMLLDLFNTAQEYSTTNLGISEFTFLASSVINNGITNLEVVTLDGTMEQGEEHAEFYLDQTSVYETVLKAFYTEIGDAPAK